MSGALRRVGVVVIVYAAAAWVVLGGGAWLRRALALPALFETLLRGGLLLGVPAAVVLAWRYPMLGKEGDTTSTPGEAGGAAPATSAFGEDVTLGEDR